MSIEQMRVEIVKVYPGTKWRKRVERMPDDQVLAIYKSFERTGKLKRQTGA